jgi:ATP/maltotriose-dependent transcriptional regulator MalT
MATDLASAPVLDRPVLRMGIRSGLETGSLLLIADAGFGKTTALQDALSDGPDAA